MSKNINYNRKRAFHKTISIPEIDFEPHLPKKPFLKVKNLYKWYKKTKEWG